MKQTFKLKLILYIPVLKIERLRSPSRIQQQSPQKPNECETVNFKQHSLCCFLVETIFEFIFVVSMSFIQSNIPVYAYIRFIYHQWSGLKVHFSFSTIFFSSFFYFVYGFCATTSSRKLCKHFSILRLFFFQRKSFSLLLYYRSNHSFDSHFPSNVKPAIKSWRRT